jgi:hypothetical protein
VRLFSLRFGLAFYYLRFQSVSREVSHQYESDDDNERVINYFSINQMVEYLQAENAHIREANQQNHVRLERHELV